MLITKAIFERKISSFEPRNCVIEGIEVMNEEEFEKFSNNLLGYQDFISKRKDEMYIDVNGQVHGLLAMNKDSGDGILIDSQGYDYPRYVAFLPNIKSYIEDQISIVAKEIVREAKERTSNGSWSICFDEIEEYDELVVKENNGIGAMLYESIASREEVAEVEILNDSFDMTIYLDYCTNLDEEIIREQSMEL